MLRWVEEGGCFPYIPARWVMTILGFLGFFNVYALRVNLSVAMVAMVNHTAIAGDSPHSNDCPVIGPSSNSSSLVNGPFLWGPSTQSWILSSFFIGYIMTQVPGGRLSEMIGPKWLYGGGILTTAVFSLVTPLAAIYGDVWGVVAVRILIGLGEGVTYPAMHVLIARWIPQFERSFKATLIYLGAPIGTVKSGDPTLPRKARVLRTLHYACAGVIQNFLAAGFFRHLIYDSAVNI
ncbi:hypothetical protein LAZ67_11003773 [Cordylochernes scorpioides]|uniref:Major facilitator superfamily (MFS) profile domain-containing protein n=1 Tax=Cordylochernes scorpioides TaxID=51811 RepID=A0ABY6L069_9ARAC|nr:hypothetical protein LAZ67_11003773 [Cordylochernes scorpioides]